ncbi:MAG TPA: hypothetical protein VKD24_02650 [Candidatus Angelobacter sp.]|nr:hypothetical protein [Candidatus Angelobacter sp.]
MELAHDTQQLAKYSPTSTPLLDLLRPLSSRRRGRVRSGDYFFLSGTIILTLIALPWLNRAAGSAFAVISPQAIAFTVLVIPALALAAAGAVHETGHLLVAVLSGFRLPSSQEFGASRELFSCSGFQPGIIRLEAPETDKLGRRLLYVAIAGPAVSLLVPLALELFVMLSRPRLFVAFCIHVFSAMSALLGVAELLPDLGKGVFSDGARILMLVRKDVTAERWISNLRLQRALVRGEHPRTWDGGAIVRATSIQDESRDFVIARWLAYLWALEGQDITSSTKYLEEALAAPNSAAAGLRDLLFLEAAVFQAWFREDAKKARFWAGQIRQSKLVPLQQLRLKIVLLWSDGKLFDAWEKLGDYFYLLRDLPSSPARDLVEQSAMEWKSQLESRMLMRAWRAMSMAEEAEHPSPEGSDAEAGATTHDVPAYD